MLYDSTKTLLRNLLQSLETADTTGWDDRIETGKECLYEMHQMARPLYKAYRTEEPVAEKVNRAIPHVKSMVNAIRRKDHTTALESGKAALAEL